MDITKSHRAYFKAAKAVSELSTFNREKIGCAAVYGHRIISTGFNSMQTHTMQKKYNNLCRFKGDAGQHTLHAEVKCLLPLVGNKDIDFSRVSLYIYRQHKNGTLALAKPCPSCASFIKDLGIRNVYYTGEGSYIHEEFIY